MEKAVRVLERLAVRLGIHQILFQSGYTLKLPAPKSTREIPCQHFEKRPERVPHEDGSMSVDQDHFADTCQRMTSEGEAATGGSFQHGRGLLDELRGRQGLYPLDHDSPPVPLRAVLCGPVHATFVHERHC